jgi:hypothetical protein
VTLVSGTCSSGMVPRGRAHFPFLDHWHLMRLICAGGWTAFMRISAQTSTVLISTVLHTTVRSQIHIRWRKFTRYLVEYPWPRQAPPTVTKTTGDLWRECERSCGPRCFRNIERGDMSEETPWEDWDWEEFKTILEMAPDALPCQLAILCRKPCREVRPDHL